MSTTPVDNSTDSFYYAVDLQIDPPLPDSKAKAGASEYLTCKQVKDEDVTIVNGEIAVISRNITEVKGTKDPDDYSYGYKNLKSGVKALAKLAKDAGSSLNGHVLVKDADNNFFFRLNVVNNIVKVEAASLGWPDGTTSPVPTDGARVK